MYDELVKRLREDAEDGYLIYTRVGDDVAKAADAIEELQKKINAAEWDVTCDPEWNDCNELPGR